MKKIVLQYYFFFLFTMLMLSGCRSYDYLAPVEELKPLPSPLKKSAASKPSFARPLKAQKLILTKKSLPRPLSTRRQALPSTYLWPLKGPILNYFQPQQEKKGIDIAGKKGEKILAIADGQVVYAGKNPRGYGQLIIIKHSPILLSAYGNTAINLVKEGTLVKKGDRIAEIGKLDQISFGLHLEIRKNGTPVNPLTYLPRIGER